MLVSSLPSAERSSSGAFFVCSRIFYTVANDSVIFKDPMGDAVAADSIVDGGGVVGFFGDDRVVVVRADGKLHAVSAVCTHQGCTVGVNTDEHTLDCPCHGSRYTLTGKVVEGPAVRPLGTFNVAENDGTITLAE